VIYPVDKFYRNVCNGVGRVVRYEYDDLGKGEVSYLVESVGSKCPLASDWFKEKDLKKK
jgi:hypothetical protein